MESSSTNRAIMGIGRTPERVLFCRSAQSVLFQPRSGAVALVYPTSAHLSGGLCHCIRLDAANVAAFNWRGSGNPAGGFFLLEPLLSRRYRRQHCRADYLGWARRNGAKALRAAGRFHGGPCPSSRTFYLAFGVFFGR